VGQTIAGLSHAIKNITGGLKGGAFVLEKGIELNDKKYLMQGWEMVKGNVDKITNLSMDLLNYAKDTDLDLQIADPNHPAREVIDLMRPRARALGIDLIKDFSDQQNTCQFDSDLIYRCLLNLVTNAMDACAHNAADPHKKKVVLRTRKKPDGSIVYQVQDNGCGMTAEVRSSLFQRFFSTKGSDGTGIGLMISKKIVDQHNGEITVESEEGVGSTFVVRIPGKQPDRK
jgi:signal transduction histidine kinase